MVDKDKSQPQKQEGVIKSIESTMSPRFGHTITKSKL